MARQLGILTPDYWQIDSKSDLENALHSLDGKGVLKTRRDGYDGKGQMRVASGDDSHVIWQEMGGSLLFLNLLLISQRK